MISSNGAQHKNGLDISVPRHVAIIMDGNGRWASARGFPRIEGHRAGVKSVRATVEEARRLGVRYLTLFCFSTENWGRPEQEVSTLMRLLHKHLDGELELMLKNQIRLRAIGNLGLLPDFVRRSLQEKEDRTRNMSGMDLVLAISYGGREEILQAVRSIVRDVAQGKILLPSGDDLQGVITEEDFGSRLYAADIPDPELLIRTSGENRISNFLLWQLAYTEIVVSPVYWPDFGKEELSRCLREFSQRTRRFGLTDEQMSDERRQLIGGPGSCRAERM